MVLLNSMPIFLMPISKETLKELLLFIQLLSVVDLSFICIRKARNRKYIVQEYELILISNFT